MSGKQAKRARVISLQAKREEQAFARMVARRFEENARRRVERRRQIRALVLAAVMLAAVALVGGALA